MNIYSPQGQNEEVSPEQRRATEDKPRANYQRYVDPTGEFSSQELAASFWYVRHKALLRRIFIASLIITSFILWGTSLWAWGEYAFYGYESDITLFAQMSHFPDYTALAVHFAAQPLQIVDTQIVQSSSGKYDSLSDVTNPNTRFLAQATFHYSIDGQPTDQQTAFILPTQTNILGALGVDTGGIPGNATLMIDSVHWTRLSSHTIANPQAWQDDRLNFVLTNLLFAAPGGASSLTANLISFDLTNDTSYSYDTPQFLLGLYDQQALVGVIPFQLPSFASAQTQHLDLRSFAPNLNVTTVQVFPQINVYDQDSYSPLPN